MGVDLYACPLPPPHLNPQRAYRHWLVEGGGLSREKLFFKNLGLNMRPVGAEAARGRWLMGTLAVAR
jgi:hypothetical protein